METKPRTVRLTPILIIGILLIFGCMLIFSLLMVSTVEGVEGFLFMVLCTFPFAVIYLLALLTHHTVSRAVAIVVLSILAIFGFGMAYYIKLDYPADFLIGGDFALNMATEFFGTVILLIVLSAGKTWMAILVILNLFVVALIGTADSINQAILLNISTEIFGSLLIALLFSKLSDRDKPKLDSL